MSENILAIVALRPLSEKIKHFAKSHGLTCYWCKLPVDLTVSCEHPLAPTREHLTPKSLKKKGQYIKQVLAHRRCNEMRGVMDADAFLRLMAGENVTKYKLWPHIFHPDMPIEKR